MKGRKRFAFEPAFHFRRYDGIQTLIFEHASDLHGTAVRRRLLFAHRNERGFCFA